MTAPIELLGIGNSIVDKLCRTEDQELNEYGLIKGSMALIDAQQAAHLESMVNPVIKQSGGSVANSVVHFANLGGRSGFIGKVANDIHGRGYVAELVRADVQFTTNFYDGDDVATGRCYVFVTPDGQRTMCTHLGASTELTLTDINAAAIEQSKILLIEGYLWSSSVAREMIIEAVSIARRSNTVVAFTLSDPYLVDAYRAELQPFVENYVDLLFGNEHEAYQLYHTSTLQESIDRLQQVVAHLVLTRGEKGSVSIINQHIVVRHATPVELVVDTTGAGDAYAGGYLYGYLQNHSTEQCMDIASNLAAQVIRHYGGRNVSC